MKIILVLKETFPAKVGRRSRRRREGEEEHSMQAMQGLRANSAAYKELGGMFRNLRRRNKSEGKRQENAPKVFTRHV